MALTDLQRTICRLIAGNRIRQGESYVAGGVALNELTGGRRVSRDIDLFHDTREALEVTWGADHELLTRHGYAVEVLRERPSFVECRASRGEDRVLMQWVCDSAFRFFPLVQHPDFGLVLHPFDLATNKVLALVGRTEVRDWVDVMTCSQRIQHLGFLAWAAAGKDPGFNPKMILSEAGRANRFSQAEVSELAFLGETPRAADLSRQWRECLAQAGQIADLLPPEEVGKCVLAADGDLFRGTNAEVSAGLATGTVRFHAGTIRGVYPAVIG